MMREMIRVVKSTVLDKTYIEEYAEPNERYTCWSQPPSRSAKSDYPRIRLQPQAVEQLLAFIHWGERTRENRVEQAGMLYGYIAEEDPNIHTPAHRWSVVCGILAGNTPKSTPMEVDIPAEEWLRMQRELERVNASLRESAKREYQALGWFHTHPNWLDAYFSKLDIQLQRDMAASNDRFGLVLNPHRQIWAAFAGPDSRQVLGVLELNDALLERYSFEPREVDINTISGRTPRQLKQRANITDFGYLNTTGHSRTMSFLDSVLGPYYIPIHCYDARLTLKGEYEPGLNVERYYLIRKLFQSFRSQLNTEMIASINGTVDGLFIQPEAMFPPEYVANFLDNPPKNKWLVRYVREADWRRVAQERMAVWKARLPMLLLTDNEYAIALPLDDEGRRR